MKRTPWPLHFAQHELEEPRRKRSIHIELFDALERTHERRLCDVERQRMIVYHEVWAADRPRVILPNQ